MNNFISKTSEQIKEHMLFWFLKYYNKSVEEFDGSEQFTLFDKIPISRKELYLRRLFLQPNELPVFILVVDKDELIINTTNKFVRLENFTSEFINYTDFEWHNGFNTIVPSPSENERLNSIKTNGNVSKFGLKLKNGQIIYWNVPTGSIGFAFWNITKKCELIGRKYVAGTNNNEA